MKIASRKFCYGLMGALMLMGAVPSRALAQDDHSHTITADHRPQTADQKRRASALVEAVRQATQQFQNVENAGPDYVLMFGCVSGSDFGAMGMHFVSGALPGDGEVEANSPEIPLYEPLPNGRLRLTGADVRQPQSLRARPVLHAACLGLEGESQRRVHELEPQRFV
jgi:hypothetical protein